MSNPKIKALLVDSLEKLMNEMGDLKFDVYVWLENLLDAILACYTDLEGRSLTAQDVRAFDSNPHGAPQHVKTLLLTIPSFTRKFINNAVDCKGNQDDLETIEDMVQDFCAAM